MHTIIQSSSMLSDWRNNFCYDLLFALCCFQDKEVAVVVSFLEIYCDRVRDLGEAYMSHGEREIDGLKTTSDIYRQMKSVSDITYAVPCSRNPLGLQ